MSMLAFYQTRRSLAISNKVYFTAIKFLKDFQRDVMQPGSFSWTEYDKAGKKCRQVERCEWPQRIQDALPSEWAKARHDEGRVYFGGTTFTAKSLRQHRRAEKQAAEELPGLCDDAHMIQRYMNARTPNLFTETVAENYDRACSVAEALESENSREHQRRMLASIYEQPLPFYNATGTGRTVRLYSQNPLLNVRREVRAALTPSWREVDLANCQLAICAALWDVSPVIEYLRSGQKSIWQHFWDVVGIPAELRGATKQALKDSLYATCYGMGRCKVERMTTEALAPFGIKKAGKLFVKDRFITSLFAARDTAMLKIRAMGGETDYYGRWIPEGRGRLAHSILADVAQSYEMALIAPVFELASQTEDFQVLLYQFDGVSIHFTRREEAWREKLDAAVSAKAKELGFITGLKWQD